MASTADDHHGEILAYRRDEKYRERSSADLFSFRKMNAFILFIMSLIT